MMYKKHDLVEKIVAWILIAYAITLILGEKLSIFARNAPVIFTQSAPQIFTHDAPLCRG
jgi:hypothetical protein